MSKMAILIIVLFVGVAAMFAISNNDTTTINVPFDKTYELSKIGLLLISSGIGFFLTLLLFVIRDTKRLVSTHQYQRRQKKAEKIQSLYSKALDAILAHDDVDARSALEGIMKIEDDHTAALLRLGDIAASREQFEEATGFYKRAYASEPKNLEVLFSQLNLMEQMERWTEALPLVEEILDISSDSVSALYRKRVLLERDGRWDEVLDVQKAILKHDHNDEDKKREQDNMLGYRYEMSRESLDKGEVEKAGKGFRALIKENVQFVPAYLGMAETILQEGEAEEAISFLEKGFEKTASLLVLARLEDLLIAQGEPSRLIRTFTKAISESPHNDVLKYLLGKLYYRLEMIDDAFDILAKMEMPDKYPDYYKLKGELLLRRDQCKSAVEEFKKTPGLKRSLRLPYCCGSCSTSVERWSGRCPECGSWNSFEFKLHASCKE